jgi:hypothetical protein
MIQRVDQTSAALATGVVIVIDVIRAFTGGAKEFS